MTALAQKKNTKWDETSPQLKQEVVSVKESGLKGIRLALVSCITSLSLVILESYCFMKMEENFCKKKCYCVLWRELFCRKLLMVNHNLCSLVQSFFCLRLHNCSQWIIFKNTAAIVGAVKWCFFMKKTSWNSEVFKQITFQVIADLCQLGNCQFLFRGWEYLWNH